MWFVKKIYILETFTHICNLPLSKGIFSQQKKIAKVVTIFISGDMSEFNNYRPISVFSQFQKLSQVYFIRELKHISTRIRY